MRTEALAGLYRFAVLRVLGALMIREMITRYGRSWGGYVWAIVEPLGIITVLSIGLSQLLAAPALGKSFLLFYATGYLPFYFFSNCAEQAGSAVAVNRELMQLPGVTPLAAILARFFLTLLTLAVVGTIILAVVALTLREGLRFDIARALQGLGCAALLGLGMGVMNAVTFPFVPIWRQLWGLIRVPLMLTSGIFYTFGTLPAHVQAILWWNPVLHCIGAMRGAFYIGYRDDYVALGYVVAVALSLLILGLALLGRHQHAIIESQ
ncbi:ABC transporter permease [Frigidibacter sp. MR17.24]|uniref:ABC transporter permease n=1 Tax=Frigidibacter sp. MR17.24 TaxID=3127345 RepID=UPI0030130C0F